MTVDLLVVGGGITGLAAAWEAVLAGARVTLVEAAPQLGGKVRTETIDGQLLDLGPDSVVTYRPAALALIDELGLTPQVIPACEPRLVHLRVNGQLMPFPDAMGMVLPRRLGPLARTRTLSWRYKARAAADLVLPRTLGPEDTSIGQFLRARLGTGVVERFAQPMVGGIYGASVDDLSLDAVLPSLRAAERDHRSLVLASLAEGRRSPGGGSPFRTLTSGMGALPDALARHLAQRGADLRTGVSVVALERSEPGRTSARLSDGTRVTATSVVLATGATAMTDLLEGHADDAVAALRQVPQASSTVVTLGAPESAFDVAPTAQGWLEAGPAPVSGVTITSAKWPGRVPPGRVLLRAFVPGRLGPLATQPDPVVVDAVVAHIRPVLGLRGEPDLVRVTRWARCMPTYSVGHLDRVARVREAVDALPGWNVAGSALHGVGVPECIADGRTAARAALAELGGLPA